ncbi:MAG: hypothetical protein J7623_13555 [Chitinophaga sp.]|uniref:hypothetical protein n=1 Tax=Chitinophaga sp. TaxID=1869181 RepID=UPI001B002F24|nr:hypothetical protein [Chitinophaga sp.]MBO9729657.1 hypothetical protein [Chitinophaga sp.]
MDDSLSIFDRGFLDTPYIRRRELLPLALKIYIWFGMVFGGLTFISALLNTYNYYMRMDSDPEPMMTIFPLCTLQLAGILLFLMTLLLWMEVSWAVKFNLIIGITWFCFNLLMFIIYPNIGILYLLLPCLLIQIPYFVLVFLLRKKWTHFYSLTGKEIQELIKKNQPHRQE